jgi:hypothetical protein
LNGAHLLQLPGINEDNFSIRWTGKTQGSGVRQVLDRHFWQRGMRLTVDGQTVIEELNNRRTRTLAKDIQFRSWATLTKFASNTLITPTSFRSSKVDVGTSEW